MTVCYAVGYFFEYFYCCLIILELFSFVPKAIFIVEVEVLLTRYGGAANLAGFEEVYVHTYLHTNIHTNIWSVVQIYVCFLWHIEKTGSHMFGTFQLFTIFSCTFT